MLLIDRRCASARATSLAWSSSVSRRLIDVRRWYTRIMTRAVSIGGTAPATTARRKPCSGASGAGTKRTLTSSEQPTFSGPGWPFMRRKPPEKPVPSGIGVVTVWVVNALGVLLVDWVAAVVITDAGTLPAIGAALMLGVLAAAAQFVIAAAVVMNGWRSRP